MSSSSIELKERSGGNGGPTAVDSTSNDWICGDTECKHVNFGRRTSCQKCQKERSDEHSSGTSSGGSAKKKLGTEIGKAAAEKSRGLFSAEDWQCSKCANVNWARRQTCNMCNAPKFSDVEERTGYGGGYNDRGVVEYKERSESDSEYDEFGRLKKRKTNRNHKEKTAEENVKKSGKEVVGEEDEDEDEEDDGDGDLSKYDLWGDDEVVAAAVKTTIAKSNDNTAAKKRKSRSRSRSRSPSSSSTASTTSSSSSTVSSASSSSTSSSTGGRGTSRSGSSSASTSDGRHSRSRPRHRQPTTKATNEEQNKATSNIRSLSKTLSQQSHSSHKSTRHNNSKSRSRSTSSARKRRRERTSRTDWSKDRSRSHSSSRKYSNSNTLSTKYKRINRSRSPTTSYRKRSRTRSRSPVGKRRR